MRFKEIKNESVYMNPETGEEPMFLCDGYYYEGGERFDFNIDLDGYDNEEEAKEYISKVIFRDYVDVGGEYYDDYSIAFNVTDADGKFLFGGWWNEDATEIPEWSDTEIKFGDANWWFSKINESGTDDSIMELFENPDTVWVGTFSSTLEDPDECTTVLKLKNAKCADILSLEVIGDDGEKFMFEIKFKLTDPYKFYDEFGGTPFDFGYRVDGDIDLIDEEFDGISTNKKDWVAITEGELGVYDKPSYKMMLRKE